MKLDELRRKMAVKPPEPPPPPPVLERGQVLWDYVQGRLYPSGKPWRVVEVASAGPVVRCFGGMEVGLRPEGDYIAMDCSYLIIPGEPWRRVGGGDTWRLDSINSNAIETRVRMVCTTIKRPDEIVNLSTIAGGSNNSWEPASWEAQRRGRPGR